MKPVIDKTLMPEAEFAESKAVITQRKLPASTLFLWALAAVALYFCYLIARPLLNPIFLAVVIAIVFHPLYAWLRQRIRRRNLAALSSTILVLVGVVVPTVVLGIRISKEVHGLYQLLNEKSAEQGGWNPYAMHFVDHVTGWAGQHVDLSTLDLRGAVVRSLEQISRSLVSWGARIVSNIISLFAEAAIAFFTLFFLFRDGESIRARLAAILPLKAGQFDRIFTGVSNSLIANVQGCLAVGLAQGSLLSLGFWVLGLPSPILWGVVTGLCSLIPIVGSAAVWAPAVIVLFISGHTWKALILLGWSAALVAHIDNVVRPYVISERAKMHPLLVFFALLGGVSAFGVMGLFIGPLVMSFTLIVLELLSEGNLDESAASNGRS